MIADTRIWIDFLGGNPGEDIERFRQALKDGRVMMAPVVLAELLSSTRMTEPVEKALLELELA